MPRYLIPVAFIAAFFVSAPVHAYTVACSSRLDVVDKLDRSYAEKPVSMGLASNGSVVEVFASQIGTFSIVITRPDGLACIVSAGEGWENLPPKEADQKS